VDVASSLPLGYALVTGASRGIGRALAVELARWEFPLILVARDLEKLKDVAHEIETCYGVKCCVIQADLSEPNAAENIYKVTRNAGLTVDVLVNNAGICTHGEAVDMEVDTMKQIVQVNAGSVATLSHLYGRDMKANKRGRILFVSSVMGAVPAGPHVATYAATKAFEKTLSISMGRELAKYGVGVTCLMPGAVGGTAFRQASNSEEAVCWKIPFYPLAAPDVAGAGVRALLSGESEVCPGWMNRSFLRVMQPMIPQRLTTSIVEFFWNPLTVSRTASPIKDGEIDSLLSTPLDSSESNNLQSLSVESPRELELPPTNLHGDMTGNVTDTSENNMETMEIEIVGIKDDKKPIRTTQETGKVDHPINDMPSELDAHIEDSHKEAMEDLFISEF
jgi:short-subunit dehydrogenase